jgi:hypothetical protein
LIPVKARSPDGSPLLSPPSELAAVETAGVVVVVAEHGAVVVVVGFPPLEGEVDVVVVAEVGLDVVVVLVGLVVLVVLVGLVVLGSEACERA